MKKLFFMLMIASTTTWAQKKPAAFQHVEPLFWWTGMKNPSVQILFHNADADLTTYQVSVHYEGVTLTETKQVENTHYLFVTLNISKGARAGQVPIIFTNGKKSLTYLYEIRSKPDETNRIQGFNSSDVVYLIMPDRFANGDPTNDSIPGMLEGAHRNKPFGRHGGDLKGINDHLDYLKDFGITAIWLNPVLENNQRSSSYHGYAITDLYHVDRRFGSNEYYQEFINRCHAMGLKVIQDMVLNHIGIDHWLMHDLPEQDWIHQFPQFTRTNYKAEVISDPHHAEDEVITMSDGWFDHSMPDVNQQNELVATYLIQNTLWWIGYAGIDGIRMDTYPFPDKNFMARWARTVTEEYPTFNMVGEVWMRNVSSTAYWQKGKVNKDGYQSYLPSLTDFPFYFATMQALNENGNWNSGLVKLYDVLSQDFEYPDANANLVFLDNHDLSRFYTSIGKDFKKFKMGLAFLLTTRGVPEIYYGTELLMEGDESNHSTLRKDFPGGWKEDAVNAFTKAGRTQAQNEAFDYMKKILNWRKQTPVIHDGKLVHYTVQDNIYVYFRYNHQQTVMVVINGNATDKTIDTKRYTTYIKDHKSAVDVVTRQQFNDLSNLSVPAQTALILELK